jgi:hypothetical protein
MAKQTFTTGQVLTAAQMTSLQQTAMLGGAASAKTASYTLVAADAGTAISMTNAGATTITVNTGLFAAGDTVHITNLGAGVCTITAGTATVNSSASLALAQYESGFLDFTSSSAAIFVKGAGAAAASGGMTLLSTTTLSGSSTNITGISQDYVNLYILITGATNATADGYLYYAPNSSGNNGVTYNTNAALQNATGTYLPLTGQNAYTRTDANNAFAINIYNYTSTSTYKPVAWSGYYQVSGGSRMVTGGGGHYFNDAITSILVYADGYNFTSGTIKIYGVK